MTKTERRIAEILSGNIKRFRMKNGLSQEKLAELMDISPTTVSNYETCDIWPSRQNFARLADVLGVKPYQLFMDFPSEIPDVASDVLERLEEHFAQQEPFSARSARKRVKKGRQETR